MTKTKPITPRQFLEAEGTEDWRVVSEGACAFFRTKSFADSVALLQAIGEIADAGDAPDVDIRSGGVTVRLITTTAENYGLSESHIELARRISALAQGARTVRRPVRRPELARHPRRARYRRGDAVLASRSRLQASSG